MKLVIVEAGTIEGFTAAWVVTRALKGDCQIVEFAAGDHLPLMTGRDVLILGVSFARNQVISCIKTAAAFKMIDNDFKAKNELAGIKEVKVNMKQTAARMAWEYLRCDFRVRIGKEKKQDYAFSSAPWIVDFSTDEKRWKWKEMNPFFVRLAIEECYGRSFEDWDELATRDLAVVIEQGKTHLTEKQKTQPEKESDHGELVGGSERIGGTDRGDIGKAPRKNKSKK